ncbi:MAG: cupredoxin domain-containing protein, partial [Actinomycetota bacterium]
PGDPADADRTVEVVATEDLKFDPPALEVTDGETITFEVTNDTSIPHEFVLGDEAYQDSHEAAMAEGMDHEDNGVSLEPGATEEVTWTFSEAGEVLYACHVAGHYDAGMKGTVTVE